MMLFARHLLGISLVAVLVACGAPLPQGSFVPTPTPSAPASAQTDVCHVAGITYCVQNPNVRQDTISSTICKRGWTATIRPPVTYTDDLKQQQMRVEGLSGSPADFEEDHRLPLELGGAPRDPSNLSPQPRTTAGAKDADESAFRRLVCPDTEGKSQVSLVAAQVQFIAKWLGPYPEYKTP